MKINRYHCIFLLLSITLLFISSSTYAQRGNGTIKGTIIDDETNDPIESAAVSLYRIKDSSIVIGSETNNNGEFLLEAVPFGRYYLEVNMIGYNTAVLTGLSLNANKNEISLETIRLKAGITETEEILVEGEKSPIEFHPDKKVFNVSEELVTQTGSATDVLSNIPSVTVDQDGNVSLRGSENVRILLDGKPFGLDGPNRSEILQQIPASEIESVELITNPSAKYNPEGTSGIINIVLKKNSMLGYNGDLSLRLGTGDKYTGSANINLKNNRIRLFANYNFRRYNSDRSGSSFRESFLNNSLSFNDEVESGFRRRNSHFIKAGIEYFINDKNSIGLSGIYNDRSGYRFEKIESKEYDSLKNITTHFLRDNNEDEDGYNLEATLFYTGKFKNPKQILSGEFTYSRSYEDEVLFSRQTDIVPQSNTPDKDNDYEKDFTDNYDLQFDYVHPFSKESKLEVGYKGNYRRHGNDFRTEYFDYNQNTFVNDTSRSNDFIYKEYINAVYGLYTGSIKGLGFQFGARLEHSSTKGLLVNTNETFNKNYWSLFPSASLTYSLGSSQEMQLSYSRRIRRPRLRFLNPFPNSSDPLYIRKGNPDLDPEFIDSYELSYLHYFNTSLISPTIFFRQSHDDISRVRTLTDSNITYTTFDNYNSTKTYGVEFIVNSQPFKWWNINGSFSYFRAEVDANNIEEGLVNDTYSWSGRVTSSIRLPDLFDVQLSYFYSGDRISAQGEIDPFQSLSIALRKDLFDKKATIGLNVNDIFNTLKFNINLKDSDYTETFSRKRESRNVFLTFTYRFGQSEKSRDKKRKRDNGNQPDMDFDY